MYLLILQVSLNSGLAKSKSWWPSTVFFYCLLDGSSECLSSAEQMDTEDMLNPLGWTGDDGSRQKPDVGSSSFPALSPMVVMKNVLVKQGSSSSELQSWTVQPSFEVISAQPQLVFLHPSVPPPVSPFHASEKKSDSRNYLPILNSYTKIAPHPVKRSLSLTLEERGEASDRKRTCTDRHRTSLSSLGPTKTDVSPSSPSAVPPDLRLAQDSARQSSSSSLAGGALRTVHSIQLGPSGRLVKGPRLTPEVPPSPPFTVDGSGRGAENTVSPSTPAAPSSPPATMGQLRRTLEAFPEPRQSKHRRFQNTLVVLHRSGLLEITLKTKELIRQNQATQVELDRLKEQTQLLVEAAQSNAPQAWAKLQASLSVSNQARSGLKPSPAQPGI
ncbi:CLOCK-interacting pacemaker isoform X2 [Ornithorhynchus anatinus]|uniref:CLOCK-interacting pacemaker isoform X2 n=1 Tax=Ornithorhynchus anatinus TaxID=9258 RepID=UPI0010A7A1FB|nr:CLOCK-interacting pacemaker isoform X2 [Ornithorhynchus anatinus]